MTAPKSWEHTFHSLDVEPSDLSVGGDVIPLWRAKRNRASLPAWSDFEMMDFRPWLGLVSLDDVSRDLFDCTVRLWGTELSRLYGFDATGVSAREGRDIRGLTQEDFDFLVKVADDPCIATSHGTVDWKKREFVTISRVFLPLAEDGKTVDRILAVAFSGQSAG